MGTIGFFLMVIFLWFMYNFFVKIVLPIYRTTRTIRQQFKNMAGQRQEPSQPAPPPAEKAKPKVGEYIDFEEIK